MNQMELKTHECLQYWLPQIAVALQDIAKELKKQNIQQEKIVLNDTTECKSIKYFTKLEALKMMMDAGIPLQFDDDGDIVLSNGELVLGNSLAFLTTAISSAHQIITTGESIKIKELTESHIKKFITDYKTLEKEILK